MSERAPGPFAVGPSQSVAVPSRVVAGLAVFCGLVGMLIVPGFWPLLFAAAIFAVLVHAWRVPRSRMAFYQDRVDVQTVLRATTVSAEHIRSITLSARPGAAQLHAMDGGNAVVSLSALAYESAADERLRLANIEALRALYGERGLTIRDRVEPGSRLSHRKSPQIAWRWLPLKHWELAVAAGLCVLALALSVL